MDTPYSFSPPSILEQLLTPVGECLTPEVARHLVDLHASAEVQARLEAPAPCNRQAQTVAPVFSPCPWPAPAPLCVACGADGARPAWRSTELASRWRAGAAGESSQWGHGRGAGRRRWVGSREKWLYFGSLVISGACNYLLFQANKAYPDKSRWIR